MACPPVAVDDGPYDVWLPLIQVGGVLDNDTPCGATPVISVQPQHGAAVLQPDGAFTYTPDEGYEGADSFTYVLSPYTATAEVTFNVECRASIADDLYRLTAGETLDEPARGVASNDLYLCGLDLVIVDEPEHGIATLAADGAFTYTPDPGFVGTDSFSYSTVANEPQAMTAGWRGGATPSVIAPVTPATVTLVVEETASTPSTTSPSAPTTDPSSPAPTTIDPPNDPAPTDPVPTDPTDPTDPAAPVTTSATTPGAPDTTGTPGTPNAPSIPSGTLPATE